MVISLKDMHRFFKFDLQVHNFVGFVRCTLVFSVNSFLPQCELQATVLGVHDGKFRQEMVVVRSRFLDDGVFPCVGLTVLVLLHYVIKQRVDNVWLIQFLPRLITEGVG